MCQFEMRLTWKPDLVSLFASPVFTPAQIEMWPNKAENQWRYSTSGGESSNQLEFPFNKKDL